tara:strand:+ start:568 stop:855 length:288 start_codon:yes stop_codon:yes gene_type:complete
MATQDNIQKAINLLAKEQDSEIRWSFSHSINNQTDLDNIDVEDDKTFTFTFADVETKADELDAEDVAKVDLKASAKAKLISGEALTEDEANTIVL